MRRAVLSHPLPVFGLVSHYLTNYLIGRSPISERRTICPPSHTTRRDHRVLLSLSADYPRLRGTLGTYYSPVRHFTRGIAPPFSFDLHVLAMPPAFNLSQDQTLQLVYRWKPDLRRANLRKKNCPDGCRLLGTGRGPALKYTGPKISSPVMCDELAASAVLVHLAMDRHATPSNGRSDLPFWGSAGSSPVTEKSDGIISWHTNYSLVKDRSPRHPTSRPRKPNHPEAQFRPLSRGVTSAGRFRYSAAPGHSVT